MITLSSPCLSDILLRLLVYDWALFYFNTDLAIGKISKRQIDDILIIFS